VADRLIELEREVKRYELNAQQLDGLRAKDADYAADLERQLAVAQTEAKRAEEVAATLREAEEQVRIAKDSEIDGLVREVDSLRHRQQQSHNEQLNYLEEENRKLVKVANKSFFAPVAFFFMNGLYSILPSSNILVKLILSSNMNAIVLSVWFAIPITLSFLLIYHNLLILSTIVLKRCYILLSLVPYQASVLPPGLYRCPIPLPLGKLWAAPPKVCFSHPRRWP
jgi:hypothetical protein